jgi:hypothetical protein
MTNRDIVNQIRGMFKLLSSDALITDRVVLSEIRTTVALLVKREINLRKLLNSPNLFTTIPCIQMTPVPLGECCNYTSPQTIARSINQLPTIGDSQYDLIVRCMGIDNMREFNYTSPQRYANLLRMHLPERIYFWIMDNYLYVTNPDAVSVNLYAYIPGDISGDTLYPSGCDCKQNPDVSLICMNPLDREAKIPSYMIEDVKTIVSQKLLKTYYNVGDIKDDKDINQPTK